MSSAGPGGAHSEPVVSRRGGPGRTSLGGGANNDADGGSPAASGSSAPPGARGLLKPSIRRTIESMVSTGSQADYFSTEQTIILFDWDDTLCPSNWIRANRPVLSFFKPCPQDPKFQIPLQELQVQVEAVLKLALKLGKVVIVTNAVEPWVETSCRNFLPNLLSLVQGIPVIYARSVFDQHGLDAPSLKGKGKGAAMPGMYAANGANRLSGLAACNSKLAQQSVDELAPQRWKEVAFQHEITGFYSRYDNQSWKNIISIGDSIFERDAVRRVVLNNQAAKKKCRTKTAKLLDEPDVGELVAQVKVIHDALGLMVQYDGNLDIEIDEDDLQLDLSLLEKIIDR